MGFSLRNTFLLIPVLLLTQRALAQQEFLFNSHCAQAYQKIIQLQLGSGQQLLNEEKKRNPNNLVPYFLENYIDFFTLFFNEDPEEYARRIKNKDRRLELMDKGSSASPFHLFTKSVINFQWAAVQIKFGNHWDAGWTFRRSYLQSRENLKKFPSFTLSELHNGAMEVAAGTIPQGYRWFSNLLGIRGNIHSGMETIRKFIDNDDAWSKLFHDEAVFYYLYLKYYVANDKQGVMDYIRRQDLDLVNSHLFAYLASNLALNFQQSARAGQIILNRNRSSDYLQTPIWDFEYGYVRLNHLQSDAAFYLNRFVQNFKGKFYVKDALQKISWHYYLQGDMDKAWQYRKMIASRGSQDTEADKLAHKESFSTVWPNKLLLQARLLNDGGYHEEALAKLLGKSASDFNLPEHKLEFSYRAARIYDDLGRKAEAIKFYTHVIATGENRKEYFAARSALQLAQLHEQRGEKNTAVKWYRKCLAMKGHDFKNSIDSRAEAGLARLISR